MRRAHEAGPAPGGGGRPGSPAWAFRTPRALGSAPGGGRSRVKRARQPVSGPAGPCDLVDHEPRLTGHRRRRHSGEGHHVTVQVGAGRHSRCPPRRGPVRHPRPGGAPPGTGGEMVVSGCLRGHGSSVSEIAKAGAAAWVRFGHRCGRRGRGGCTGAWRQRALSPRADDHDSPRSRPCGRTDVVGDLVYGAGTSGARMWPRGGGQFEDGSSFLPLSGCLFLGQTVPCC
jgi:hypothetical protein